MLEARQEEMGQVVYRRARHVITENQRCIEFAEALEDRNLPKLGELMRASHESLRDDYEVSCPELDQMAEAAWSSPGCVGGRMTGAGFGGACVALVESARMDGFQREVLAKYREAAGKDGEVTPCLLADGAKAFRTGPTAV
jgi:galactokinase